ncbi:ADP-ribosyl cyclase/cyclic ADP-ribose hydrolase 1-like, partial [Arapaima gigas]
ILSGLLFFLFLIEHLGAAEMGTTPNLKHIVVGRCYNYITLVSPDSRYDCEEIWMEFQEAVVRRPPCGVRVKDYQRMFQAASQILPCNRLLFWSKTRELVHSYLAVTHHFWTLEDTLVGYMFNDLTWCGQEEKDRGFDYRCCPEWSACVNHPVYSLWRQASENFAASACGNITVVLNGSVADAFNRRSMFGSVELDGLNPRMVDHVNIEVVANPEGPFVYVAPEGHLLPVAGGLELLTTESCTRGSVPDLIAILQARGFRWTCSDTDVTFMMLQCLQNPRRSSCQTAVKQILRPLLDWRTPNVLTGIPSSPEPPRG